ncbi:MAG TPA: carbon-nitrogen hydrolase family protein [Bryobacteraceae bacterium]|nr:carbon-nitrogen hydrolase family protein [Bryobacteraceae bacterium]
MLRIHLGGSVLLLAATALSVAAPLHMHQTAFKPGENGLPMGWSVYGVRPEITPKTFVDTTRYRTAPGSLAISGNSNAAAYGGWTYLAPEIVAGQWYRFVAYYRSAGLQDEALQVVARLNWQTADGKRAGRPDYPYSVTPEGEWTRLTLDAPAPEKSAAVKIELFLQNASQATLWWDDISLEEIANPGPRSVTVATVKYHPHNTHSAEENVRQFVELVDHAVPEKTDVILLPEGMTVAGTGKSDADVSEPVPGPTTEKLGELARRKHAYIIGGIYEREAPAVYNTAVLIDREGRLIGKYRKVYLPREEIEAGLTPGNDYPVFRTDFGKIGIMICWDVEYADPARALALKGAEMILLPIWDGDATLTKARAIENHVFLVSSTYGDNSLILDPNGETQAIAKEIGTVAIAKIDLNRRYDDEWLGNMRERFMKELRLDVPMKRTGFE